MDQSNHLSSNQEVTYTPGKRLNDTDKLQLDPHGTTSQKIKKIEEELEEMMPTESDSSPVTVNDVHIDNINEMPGMNEKSYHPNNFTTYSKLKSKPQPLDPINTKAQICPLSNSSTRDGADSSPKTANKPHHPMKERDPAIQPKAQNVLFNNEVNLVPVYAFLPQFPLQAVPNVVEINNENAILSCFLVNNNEFPNGSTLINLEDMIRKHGIPPMNVARFIFSSLAKIIENLHIHDIAHRNLSLQTVYIYSQDGNSYKILLTDSSTIVKGEYARTPTKEKEDIINEESKTNQFVVINSNPYSSKFYDKNVLGNAPFPKRRDLYSMGVILFVLVFGERLSYNKIPPINSFNLIKSKWDNRPNWNTLRRYLKKIRKELADHTSKLFDVLFALLKTHDTHILRINISEWMYLSIATPPEIKKYLSQLI